MAHAPSEYATWLLQDGAFLLVARDDGRAIGFALVRPHGPGPTWIDPGRYAIVQDLVVAAQAVLRGLTSRERAGMIGDPY